MLPTFDLATSEHIGGTGARLLALIELENGRTSRTVASHTLWPGTSEKRAAANLRSTLWRLNTVETDIVACHGRTLELGPGWSTDLARAQRVARLLTAPATSDRWEPPIEQVPEITHLLSTDLLTDWYDDWVLDHRERWRQLRLHALESLAAQMIERGSSALAIEAGGAAVSIEPLRESAHRTLITAHIADGNRSEAIRTQRAYAELLHRALGVAPSQHMDALMDAALHAG